MASVSSLNSGTSISPYLDQNQNQSTNTEQSKSKTSNSSVDLVTQNSLGNDNKASSFSTTNNQNLPSTNTNDSLTQESQFAASFQKSQLLSKLPNNSGQDTSNRSTSAKETKSADSSKDLGDYGHLSTGQKKLIDDLNNRQNTTNKTQKAPAEFYNSLEPSQKSTFEGITNALENTTIISKDGKKTNGLDTIDRVDVILGEKPGKDGAEQFRLLVTLKDGIADNIKTAKNFHDVPGHGEEYPSSRQLNGGEPSIQFCFSKDGKNADIDVDYELKSPEKIFTSNPIKAVISLVKHLDPSNSDVRSSDHFDKHNKRFASEPGQQPLVKKY